MAATRKSVVNVPTVLDVLSFYLPRLARPEAQHAPAWPPDLFGLMSALLERSGAYLRALERWPPKNFDNDLNRIDQLAADYQSSWVNQKEASPLVAQIFNRLLASSTSVPISEFPDNVAAAQAALLLLAIADQTFADFNRSPLATAAPSSLDQAKFNWDASSSLGSEPATLGREIPFERLIILPKRRTPQTGLNIRSLSLHLCALRTSEIGTTWIGNENQSARTKSEVNILFLPWPLCLAPPCFLPTKCHPDEMRSMDQTQFDWFTFQPPQITNLLDEIRYHLEAANQLCRRVDLLILPEAALSESQWSELVSMCAEAYPDLAILSGVASAAERLKKSGTNDARYRQGRLELVQDKHHRWQLNSSQILQYQLGAALDPAYRWWECIKLPSRQLHFIGLNSWLLFSPLICEDLARPDPAGDLLRAVGPDLVVALLMDGPQLANRWSARNAITFADDPGSAVLSVTCAGMVDLSNIGRPDGRRTVALYKDPYTGLREIDLPRDSTGVLLTLSPQHRTEYSADGRKETLSDVHPILSGVQYIKKAEEKPSAPSGSKAGILKSERKPKKHAQKQAR